jgi:hypothetical protein
LTTRRCYINGHDHDFGRGLSGNHGTLAGAAAHDPVYAKMMNDWGEWKDALNEYNKTLGMKDNVTDTARLGKMFRASKTNQGVSVLDQLANTSTGKTLPYMLAGSAMSPWFSQGLLGKVEYPLGALAVLHPSSTRLSSRTTAPHARSTSRGTEGESCPAYQFGEQKSNGHSAGHHCGSGWGTTAPCPMGSCSSTSDVGGRHSEVKPGSHTPDSHAADPPQNVRFPPLA